MHFLAAAALASVATATPWGWGPPSKGPQGWGYRGHHRGHQSGGSGKQAAYFLDDKPSGADLITLAINDDGTVSDPIRISTGGLGSLSFNTGMNHTSIMDNLNSQGPVIISDNMLFTVNTGSNTVVMFCIDPEDPTHPTMVGSPVDTMGEWPMSVAYSTPLKQLCVLNGGAKDGVACFSVDESTGLTPIGGLRSLGMAINETTPPTVASGSASQILFTPDSSGVIALVKGHPEYTPAGPSHIVGFAVVDGMVDDTPVFSTMDKTPVLFGSVFLPDGKILASDASLGGALFDIADDLSVTTERVYVIEGQKAICWAVYDSDLNTGYLPDTGANNVYKFDATTGDRTGKIEFTTSNSTGRGPGVLDTALIGNTFYALGIEPGVVVIDLVSEKQLQFLNMADFGNRDAWVGMATYPAQKLS